MRRFRAIVETNKEPIDHNVIWYYQGKLLYWGEEAWEPFHVIDGYEVNYENEEAPEVKTVKDALDKLLYVHPEIVHFTLDESGTYEKGTVIEQLNFSWEYNKELIRSQRLNLVAVPPSVRQARLNRKITKDSIFILAADDGVNAVTATALIKFVDYIYYGTTNGEEWTQRYSIDPSNTEFTVTAGDGEYINIFVPSSSTYSRIWFNGIDSTYDFNISSGSIVTDKGNTVSGTIYTSKNHSLGEVTLKLK